MLVCVLFVCCVLDVYLCVVYALFIVAFTRVFTDVFCYGWPYCLCLLLCVPYVRIWYCAWYLTVLIVYCVHCVYCLCLRMCRL